MIWFDITTLKLWQGNITGIVRTELEFAEWLLNNAEDKVSFCWYNNIPNDFQIIEYDETENIILRHRENKKNKLEIENKKNGLTKIFRATYLLARRQLSRISWLRKTKKALTPRKNIDRCAVFSENDVYMFVRVGLDIDYNLLRSKKEEKKFKVFSVAHDLIPVFDPQYFPHHERSEHVDYFRSLALCSDLVMCVSQSTMNDYTKFIAEESLIAPKLGIYKPGSNITRSDNKVSEKIKNITKKKYILFVSTIERRKNHEMLYRAYRKLSETQQDLPLMIFVGAIGWGVDDFIKDLELDIKTRGKIQILSDVADAELHYLYKNTYFTVYPSYYEGWGLPIDESLQHGKFCLASSTSSMPEVGSDLLEYIDPYDQMKWNERLQFYVNNPDAVKEKEQNITANYKPHSWADTAESFLQEALKLQS